MLIGKKSLKVMASLLAALLAAGSISVGAVETQAVENAPAVISSSEDSYYEYLEKNSFDFALSDVFVEGGNFVSADGAERLEEHNGKNNVVKFAEKGSATYKVLVEQDGLYELELTYFCLEGHGLNIGASVQIDGVLPYEEAGKLSFPRIYENDASARSDENGNQYPPSQIESAVYNTLRATDNTGVETKPYRFALSAGEHEITLKITEESCVVAGITFAAPEQPSSYEEVLKGYESAGYKNATSLITVHAEDAKYKSKNSLAPKSTTNSATVYPSSPTKSLLNYIGGKNWSEQGDYLTWEIDVKEAGLYKLGYRYNQEEVINGVVYRSLKIDGETPFSEAEEIDFAYSAGWEFAEFANEKGEPYLIYLDEGKHTLTLTVALGEISDYYARLKTIVGTIGEQYLKILMITGETPDANRDYALFENIPGLEEKFSSAYEELIKLAEDMEQLGNTTKYAASLKNMARVLNSMLKNQYNAHRYKSDYYDQYCTISSLLNEMKDMSLSLDEIWLGAPDGDFASQLEKDGQYIKSGFFKNLMFSVQRFVNSFVSDYSLSGTQGKETDLKLWINWGRDQAQVLNLLIQEKFTSKTNIKVNVELVDATLIQGMLTSNAPDMAIQIARSNPVNYAMRGALYDLEQFSDFDEVITRFQDTATVPYQYNGGTYALPDTQSFYAMFYRSDILEELGISIPKTWDEFIGATTILQRNNMSVCMPYTKITTAGTVNTGLGGLNLFSTFLMQNNVSIYDETLTETILDSSDSINIFTYWSDFYTKYKLPTVMDFYNRLRLGTAPLGIANYTTYTTLLAAAPEIEGKWGIAEIPGFMDSNGKINNNVSGSGTGCVILNQSKHKKEAWEFLKWWTSADTQSSFSRELETILGPTGRTATSNVEAFAQLSWKSEDREILLSQWSKTNELPEAPGSYYLPRSVDQAFWSVYNGKKNVGDALAEWDIVADREMDKKQREYGLKQ